MPFSPTAIRSAPSGAQPASIRDFDRLRVRTYPQGQSHLTVDRDSVLPLLLIWMRGSGTLRQHGSSVHAPAGSLCFLPNDGTVGLCDVTEGGALVLELPVELEVRARDRVAAAIGTVITADTGAAAFLRSFLDTLDNQPPSYRPDYSGWVQACVCDMTERVLVECVGSGPTPAERAVLAAKCYVNTHLTESTLTPCRVASAAMVSLRTLNRLFAAEGESVGGWIRRHRLERCREDLLDPAKADRSISQIGALWGFLDAAHFSRTFKEAYGCSPRAYRMTPLGSDRTDAVRVERVA